jgi:hypothetical protein
MVRRTRQNMERGIGWRANPPDLGDDTDGFDPKA